jgi:AcrR family transcriptional regulator
MTKKQPELRRDQILASAKRVFAERGYQATNIADIAADTKLAHGTFYRYFKNKRDIFEQVLHEVVVHVAALSEGEEAPSTREAYEQKSRRVGMRIFRYFQRDETAARLLFYESLGVDGPMRRKVERAFELFAAGTEADLAHGKAVGFLSKDLDEKRTSYLVNALTFESIRRCLGAADPDREAAQWLEAAVRVVFHGISSRSP